MRAERQEVRLRRCWHCSAPLSDPPGTGRGQWRRYCDQQCRDAAQAARGGTVIRQLVAGDPVPEGKPRRYPSSHGYVRLRWRLAPRLLAEVYEHRVRDGVVVEDEHVHHRNHQPDDNRPENLQGMTAREHADLHREDRRAPWQRIAQMYEAGDTQPSIARQLGIDSSTVSRALGRAGVTTRTYADRFPLPSEQATRREYSSSSSAGELAQRLGVPVCRARAALREYGLPSYPPGNPKRREAQRARATTQANTT